MQIKYVVRQLIKTANGNFLHPVYEISSERMALITYDEFVEKYPDQYFEVVKIETEETCLEFTKNLKK
ncbi:hypothetical protein SAMN05216325_13316 [Nitrosomonas marina]|uniref:Uncharacterized protein n=1 Tax=Nitrosomonas marina TaxID=917 RepID=A0A1H8IIU1_9PROT|nr:hypothetical protein SAMN05216325_13316 [Nitrosomonas marina]